MKTFNGFMDYSLNALSLKQLLDDCAGHMLSKKPKNMVFSCANPHSLAIGEARSDVRTALKDADILVKDGVGVSIVAKLFGVDVGPRITGGDFFNAIMQQHNGLPLNRKTRVYFFGSTHQVLKLIQQNVKANYPHIEICGCESPPYRAWSEAENAGFVTRINAAKADILWVGMTAPKQELWTYDNREKLQVALIGNIGAVFDFFAGTYDRAPEWSRKYGLEWLFRLCKEPKRMWKRNFISPVIFVLAFFKFQRNIDNARVIY
jgi:N-acetylglucosaminyldiphosphoundecaprenol N-acetyl-beta-D-mannosaminyltransferase